MNAYLLPSREELELREAMRQQAAQLNSLLQPRMQLLEDSLNVLAQRADLDAEYQNGKWQNIGIGQTTSRTDELVYRSEADLQRIRLTGRRLANANPFAINCIENGKAYINGTGHTYKIIRKDGVANDACPEEVIAKCRRVIDRFLKRNQWPLRQDETWMRGERDGEVLRRLFISGSDLNVRFLEPEQLRDPQDIDPQDIASKVIAYGIRFRQLESASRNGKRRAAVVDYEDPVSYYIHKLTNDPLNYHTAESAQADELSAFDPNDLTGEVQHIRFNTDLAAPRGISTFWAIDEFLDRAVINLRAMSTVVGMQASIAWVRKHAQATAETVTSYVRNMATITQTNALTGNQLTYKQYRPGTVLDVPSSVDYSFPGVSVDVTKIIASVQAELRAAAARVQYPEFMFTSDPSGAPYSAVLVAEGPVVKKFERCQARTVDNDIPLLRMQLAICAIEGELPKNILDLVDIDADTPRVKTRNLGEEVDAAIKLSDAKIIAKSEVAGNLGYNYEKSQATIDQELEKDKEREEKFAPAQPGAGEMGGPLGDGMVDMTQTAELDPYGSPDIDPNALGADPLGLGDLPEPEPYANEEGEGDGSEAEATPGEEEEAETEESEGYVLPSDPLLESDPILESAPYVDDLLESDLHLLIDPIQETVMSDQLSEGKGVAAMSTADRSALAKKIVKDRKREHGRFAKGGGTDQAAAAAAGAAAGAAAATGKATPKPAAPPKPPTQAQAPPAFDADTWQKMPVFPDRVNAWKALSVDERDRQADPANSVPKRAREHLEGLPPRPQSASLSDDMKARVQHYSDRVAAPALAKMEEVMGTYVKHLTAAKINPQIARKLAMDCSDLLCAQEMESMTRQLGDHGVHHIAGNIDTANKIMDVLPQKPTPKDRAMMMTTQLLHDVGYLTPPSQNFLDEGHSRWSAEYFRERVTPLANAAFGKRGAAEMEHNIRTHDATNIDWTNDPRGSAIRVADNTSLFHKEKLPGIFRYAPDNLDLLQKLGNGELKLDEARQQMKANCFQSDVPDRVKLLLAKGVDEVTPKTRDFTVGMLGGELTGVDWVKDRKGEGHLRVNLKDNPEATKLHQLGDFGQAQFGKFAKTYGTDPEQFKKSLRFKLKNPDGTIALESQVAKTIKEALDALSQGASFSEATTQLSEDEDENEGDDWEPPDDWPDGSDDTDDTDDTGLELPEDDELDDVPDPGPDSLTPDSPADSFQDTDGDQQLSTVDDHTPIEVSTDGRVPDNVPEDLRDWARAAAPEIADHPGGWATIQGQLVYIEPRELQEANPYHDQDGRFTRGPGINLAPSKDSAYGGSRRQTSLKPGAKLSKIKPGTKAYKSLSASSKERVLRTHLANIDKFGPVYIPKSDKAHAKLTPVQAARNREVGKLEGMARAYRARADATGAPKIRRYWLHKALQMHKAAGEHYDALHNSKAGKTGKAAKKPTRKKPATKSQTKKRK